MGKNKDRGPGVLIPPPLIFSAFAAVGYFAESSMGASPDSVFSVKALGAFWVLAGLSLILYAKLLFSKHHTAIEPWKPSSTLVDSGIFAYTRNPIYLSFGLIVLGLGLYLGRYLIIASLVPSFLAIRLYVIPREERYLERQFGEVYLSYKQRVRRWF